MQCGRFAFGGGGFLRKNRSEGAQFVKSFLHFRKKNGILMV